MKEVHIIAKGKGWDKAPKEGETWGVNDIILRRDQLKLMFDMHNLDMKKDSAIDGRAFNFSVEKATKANIPIMTLKEYDFVPTSVKYPLDEIIERFKSCYFSSSIDFMVAYALYKDYDLLNLYGVNMILKNEYERQKPGLEHWIGIAKGLGKKVKVFSGEHNTILQTFNKLIYGYNIRQFSVE